MIRWTKTMRRRLCIVSAGLLLSAAEYIAGSAGRGRRVYTQKQTKRPGKAADQQKESKADRELTRHIRKSLVDDKTLSTYAHNVKIIAINGVVTLLTAW